MRMLKRFFQPVAHPPLMSLALLLLRLIVGAAFVFHGWGKMQNPFHWMGPEAPVPAFLQFLAAFSEFGGGIAWMIGLVTPLASLGILCTMTVAVLLHMVQLQDPFVSSTGGRSYELAAVYWGVAALFLLLSPGRLALDAAIFGVRKN